jgi:toxin ParE1/3/4
VRRLLLTARAERDIRASLRFTTSRWGATQTASYRTLISAALAELLADPQGPTSRARDEIRPGVRTLHIGRTGRPARHLLVYRVSAAGDIEVLRFLHDAMELRRHLAEPGSGP